MSIFPLVQVEGALAMPHMRPLNRVPPPFGREWSLVPSQFSLRTELHALYAAFLRTICLSAEAFRQAYRWDRQPRSVAEPPRPAAAPVGAALSAAQAQQAAAEAFGSRAAAGAKPAQSTQSPQATPRAQAAQPGRTPPSSHKLKAGAVAIGGAALLAWIVASHTQRPGDKDAATLQTSANAPSKPVTQPLPQSSARLADERALHDHALTGVIEPPPAIANNVSQERGVAVGAAVVAQQAAPAVAPREIAPPLATAPATRAASTPAPSAQNPDFSMRAAVVQPVEAVREPRVVNEVAGEKRASPVKRNHAAKANVQAAPRIGKRHAAQEFATYRSAALVTTQRSHGMYSSAGDYSPHQFAVNSGDEYPSVTTYASPSAASRPVSRSPVAADSTEWVNHVAQRRVTEIPDRFAK